MHDVQPDDSVIEMMSGTSRLAAICSASRSIFVSHVMLPSAKAFATFTVTTVSVGTVCTGGGGSGRVGAGSSGAGVHDASATKAHASAANRFLFMRLPILSVDGHGRRRPILLTVIGEFAQAITAREIEGNSSAILTERPRIKVS